MSSSSDIPRRDSGLRIRIDKDSSPEESVSEKNPQSRATKSTFTLPQNLEWIPKNWTWTKVKPVIRCAVAAWVSSVLFIIPAVEIYMGQASFIILISAFLSPPSDPFMGVLERELIIVGLVALTWAWSCLGIRLADLARVNTNHSVTFIQATSGEYIEPAPTVILGVFIFVGTTFLLYLRARQGPGPYLFATILSCICLDITLTTSVLIPYPYYDIGKAIIIPLGFHSAICILVSIFVFPQTISAEFTTRLQGVLTPLVKSLELHRTLKDHPVNSEAFSSAAKAIREAVKQSEAALVPLAASARLLSSDLIYSRFAPTDFKGLQAIARRMAVRANGLTIYFMVIDPTREKFPATPAPSIPASPGQTTPVLELPQSPLEAELAHSEAGDDDDETPASGSVTPTRSSRHSKRPFMAPSFTRRSHSQSRSHSHHPHFSSLLQHSLLHLSMSRVPKNEHAVGVFESQRYMDIEETWFRDPRSNTHTQQSTDILFRTCDELLEVNQGAVVAVSAWLGQVRKGRFAFWKSGKEKKRQWQAKFDDLKNLRDNLDSVLQAFKADKRLEVLEPYRCALEAKADIELEAPSHRYLFHCYVYQYHLTRFSCQNIEMLDEIIRLEQERLKHRVWTPARELFRWRNWNISDINEDEEDPERVQGLEPAVLDDLGIAKRRDPDALPPKNAFEWVMNKTYLFVKGFGGGNALYAVKAGVLTIIMCIPSFLKQTAPFAYKNRFVWAIVMSQLTLARFRGDTSFGWIARVMSTFAGGIVGALMWYISCGDGRGNPYGLGAVFGVCFPFFFYGRLYWPGPPMTNIIFFVTTVLVVGYSYQDVHIVLPGNPGFGIDVAWRRFVLVTVGVTAAFIFSFLPPSTTIRRYQRTLLATTASELGMIYCAIISFANTRRDADSQEVITSLIAIRSKLNRSAVLKANAIYEFSLRGRWPAARYQKILELQLSLSYSLSHLMSVIERMEPAWTRAFLTRTRFIDPNFQGDLLAVISMMATSLRTGEPLPQITPCPLLDRFLLKYHGFNVIHKEAEEDFGLPRSLTIETLEDEQYQMFCVAATTAFAIVSRLDRLMLAVKEIVGEQYHVQGMNVRMGVEMGSRTNTLTMRGPAIV